MTFVLDAWLVLALGFTAVALVRLLRRRPDAAPRCARGVLLLRPVDAPSAAERENLARAPSGVEQVVLSPAPLTPAAAGRWQRSDPRAHNRKLAHLQQALRALPPQPRGLLVADADVAVDDALVDALLSALDRGAALAWASPRPGATGLTRALLVQSLHSFEVLDVMALGAKPVCGKALALGPRAVVALAALPDCIGEDLELARVLHAAKLPIVRAGEAAMPGSEPPAAAVVARFTRWMQVLGAHRRALFPTVPLLFACTPALLVGALLSGAPEAWAGALALVALRTAVAARLERRPGLPLGWLAAEALLAVCWLRALAARGHVTWRGRTLHIGPHGRLQRGDA